MHKFNNCVKVQFEIGHEASLRSEVTPQGFTHDWQVFVRGADNTDIHHFVEKVVFNLHESFPKPKRVVKEPPYEVRESGYASFTFPIEVYLKSKDEPRKLDFIYDLSLNTSGPIRTSQREKRIFNNPSEEFRRKLIKGGGVGVGSDMLPLTDSNSQNTEDKSSSKKSSSESSRKHKSKESLKPDEVRSSNQFADLFGTPIKTAKLSPTTAPKKTESKHSSDSKVSSKSISKHSPHKEKEKDKESNKKDMMNTTSSKEKDKDRDRTKEKEKKLDKSMKRPSSPVTMPQPAKTIKEEPKKSSHEEAKDKEKVKSSSDISKNEKKEKKKDKKSRDEKDKKDRHKDHEIKKEPVPAPPPPLVPPISVSEKEKTVEKPDKIKPDFRDLKENVKKSPKNNKEEKPKEKTDKDKVESVEKQRHKHRKKEKIKKEEKEIKEKEKDKSAKKAEKLPPAPPVVPKEPSPPPQPPPSKSRGRSPSPKLSKNPLSALMSELPSDKESDSESSADEDAKSVEKAKMTPPSLPPPPPAPPVSRTPEQVKEEKITKEKVKKKDKKSSSKDEDGARKKKRKSKEKEEVVPEKILKVKADEEHKIIRDEPMDEDVEDRLSEPSSPVGSPQREDQEISRSRSATPPTKFTEEYVMELKDLQQKIMTLEDNAELQRVVQVIAETGQYEITKKTFDFDLCALDKSTVKRLQDLFFAAS